MPISLDRQRAIANFLDVETARIDALITKKRQHLSLMDEAESAHLDLLFGPRSGESLIRLGRMSRIQSGITIDRTRASTDSDVTLPYLRVANVQPGRLDLTEITEVTVPRALANRSALRPGDVLMTEGGDIDKLGRGTVWEGEVEHCLHQNHVFAVRPDPSRLRPDFLALLTRTSYARGYFESTGVQSTNLASTSSSKVLDFRVPVRGLYQQGAEIVAFRRFAARTESVRRAVGDQVALLAERRQALITAAVSGELPIPGAPAA